MSFIEDLQPLATATVIAHKGSTDVRGKFTESSQINLTYCHIEGESRRVLDSRGEEVISNFQIFSLENNSLWPGKNESKEEWRFTLPVADYPYLPGELEPKNIIPIRDETGIIAEEIQL